jgi:hypothetical protein
MDYFIQHKTLNHMKARYCSTVRLQYTILLRPLLSAKTSCFVQSFSILRHTYLFHTPLLLVAKGIVSHPLSDLGFNALIFYFASVQITYMISERAT